VVNKNNHNSSDMSEGTPNGRASGDTSKSGGNGGVTEAEILDLVELGASALAPGRHEAVIKAIKSDPKFGRLINSMRADRAAVVSLADEVESAPVDLIERVEARLQIEALRELAQQAAMTETEAAPSSMVVVRHPGTMRLVLESRWTRRLATAASIAILGAAGFVAVREVQKYQEKEAQRRAAIAKAKDEASKRGGETSAPVIDDAPVTPTAPTLAQNEPRMEAAPAVAMAAPITLERARELAAQGRLAISVRNTDVQATPLVLKRVDALSRSPLGGGRDSGWRAVDVQRAPAQYAMLTTPTMPVPAGMLPGTGPRPIEITIAGEKSNTSGPTLPPLVSMSHGGLAPARAAVRAIYTVELDDKDRTLSTLVDQLVQAKLGPGKSRSLEPGADDGVVFVELPKAIEPALSFAPDDVLWWNSGASSWSRPVLVPVIIETLE
jgi:hypothetical protein